MQTLSGDRHVLLGVFDKSVCKMVKFTVKSAVKSTLSERPKIRPTLIILKEYF